MQKITSFVILGLISGLASCCEPKDLYCPGGDVIRAKLPYTTGDLLTFESLNGKRFYIQLQASDSKSKGFEYTTSCSVPRKDVDCRPQVEMSGTFIDSSDVLAQSELVNFNVSIFKLDGQEKENLQLFFWGKDYNSRGGILLTDYGQSERAPGFDPAKFSKVNSFSTGEKNFTNIYILTEQEKKKSINALFDEKGRLIALYNLTDLRWYYQLD
ncbi:hypothetical protein MASR2M44_26150 [Bacteroidota bacterium]